ncbi:MAG: glycoside hydrolase domain-containing protein, partial [Promethearchaeota archaeon]
FEPTGDLVNEDDPSAVIPKENVTVSRLEYIPQLDGQVADRLLPFYRFDTGFAPLGQRNWPMWVDVGIPRNPNLPAGLYSTTMKFRCRDYHVAVTGSMRYNERVVEFKLEVEVYNFTVPTRRDLAMEIIWGVPSGWETFYHEYRLDPYWPTPPVHSYNYTSGTLSICFDWDRWDADLDRGFAGGMSDFPITWHPVGLNWTSKSYNSTYETLLKYYVGNVTDHLAGRVTPWGTPYLSHAYYFVRDEPPPELYGIITEVAKLVHSVNSSVRVMETMNRPLDTYPEEFLEHVDIYCQYIHHWHPSTGPVADSVEGWPKVLTEFRDNWTGPREKELWVYLTHNRYPTPDTDIYMAGVAPRASIWLAWVFGWDGWLYWSFNWGIDQRGGYGYAGYGESRLVDWGPGGEPLSSQRLELIRDGVEDFEYFTLLNDSCANLVASGKSGEAAAGLALLEEVRRVFDHPENFRYGEPVENDFLWQYELRSQVYLDLRARVASELGRLAAIGAVP